MNNGNRAKHNASLSGPVVGSRRAIVAQNSHHSNEDFSNARFSQQIELAS